MCRRVLPLEMGDHRRDCVQALVALAVSSELFPLCYETLGDNRTGVTIMEQVLEKIESKCCYKGRVGVSRKRDVCRRCFSRRRRFARTRKNISRSSRCFTRCRPRDSHSNSFETGSWIARETLIRPET